MLGIESLFLLAAVGTLGGVEEPSQGSKPPAQSRASLLRFDELQAKLDAPQLRLLDARPRTAYEAGHIPGAVWVDTAAAEALAAKGGGLADRDAWEAWIAPLGIQPGSEVVVYDANRQLAAARIWWILSYLGADHVALIDGGFPLWQKQGRPVDDRTPQIEPAPFPVRFQLDRFASRDDVLANLGAAKQPIIDARSGGEYDGSVARSKRGGHIPEACHLEWSTLVDGDGRFLPLEELRERVKAFGIAPGAPVIAHCQSGGRASVDAFVLERLGHPTRNYYLGWSDWGNVADTPVVEGAPSSRPDNSPKKP